MTHEAKGSENMCAGNTIGRILTDGHLIHHLFFECNLESGKITIGIERIEVCDTLCFQLNFCVLLNLLFTFNL